MSGKSLSGKEWTAVQLWMAAKPRPSAEPKDSVFIQGFDLATLREVLRQVGTEVICELGIVRAVVAKVTASQRRKLEQSDRVRRIYEDREAGTKGDSDDSVRSADGLTMGIPIVTRRPKIAGLHRQQHNERRFQE